MQQQVHAPRSPASQPWPVKLAAFLLSRMLLCLSSLLRRQAAQLSELRLGCPAATPAAPERVHTAREAVAGGGNGVQISLSVSLPPKVATSAAAAPVAIAESLPHAEPPSAFPH